MKPKAKTLWHFNVEAVEAVQAVQAVQAVEAVEAVEAVKFNDEVYLSGQRTLIF